MSASACCAREPRPRRPFTDEDTELARAIAHLTAIAFKRAELIEGLTNANIVKDLFEALAAGATTFAAAKAAEVRCDLGGPYLMVYAEPAAAQRAGLGRVARRGRGAGSRAGGPQLRQRRRCRSRPGPSRARAALTRKPQRIEQLMRECRELGERGNAAIGISELHEGPANASRAYREAVDAATIGRALLGEGGAIAYSQVGAYRYLVHIAAEDAPHDRMRAAVDRLIDYDRKRRTALLDTLERYLAERRSVIESARALFIHPNTLRQRLGRIEELTGPARSTRTTCCRSSWRSSSRGCTGGRESTRRPAAARTLTTGRPRSTRNTGIFARRRTRWGSWVQSKLPTTRLRSGSAAITIASQSCAAASWMIFLVGVAGPEHVAVGLDALALEPPDRLVDDVALLGPLCLVGSRPGLGSPNATPCTRAIVNTCTDAPGAASSIDPRDRRGRDLASLGREQDPLEPLGCLRLRVAHRRGCHRHGLAPSAVLAVIVPAPAAPAAVASTGAGALVLHPLAVPVEAQVGQEHHPADEVVGQRLASGRVTRARGVRRPAVEVDDRVHGRDNERDVLHPLGQLERPPHVRTVLSQQVVADQHRDERGQVADVRERVDLDGAAHEHHERSSRPR